MPQGCNLTSSLKRVLLRRSGLILKTWRQRGPCCWPRRWLITPSSLPDVFHTTVSFINQNLLAYVRNLEMRWTEWVDGCKKHVWLKLDMVTAVSCLPWRGSHDHLNKVLGGEKHKIIAVYFCFKDDVLSWWPI